MISYANVMDINTLQTLTLVCNTIHLNLTKKVKTCAQYAHWDNILILRILWEGGNLQGLSQEDESKVVLVDL